MAAEASAGSSPALEPLYPRSTLGMRSVSLPKKEFEDVTGGLWRISITARAGGVAAPRPSGGPAVAVQLDCPSTPRRLSRTLDPPRSIFGLPIISCRDQYYNYWVLLVLALDLTYSAFLLPLSVGFEVNDLEWTWACFVDLAAGVFFAVELFLGFHTSYMASNRGQRREVSGGRAVALYYVRYGSFWQDALCTGIWVTQIVLLLVHHVGGVTMADSSNAFQYVRIVRMVRFLFVLRQLFSLTVGSGTSSLFPFLRIKPRWAHALNIAYSSTVLLHFFACLWNFIALKEGLELTWMNTIGALVRRYAADGASPLTPAELAAVPAGERYVVGLYFSAVTIATLGYGDIVPVNVVEWLVDVVVISAGVLLFGLAMGSLADMVANSSKEARQAALYREKMEGVDAWLHSASVPRPLKHKIRAYYSDVWLKHAAARVNVSQQFLELPHSLRQEVAWELNRKLLTRLSMFRELNDQQRYALAGMLVPMDVPPGQEICMPGDAADCIWLLHDGEVQMFDECGGVHIKSAPAVLGVEALLQHVDSSCAARPFGYRTETACTLWEAHLEDLLPYLVANVGALDALSSRAHHQRELELAAMGAGPKRAQQGGRSMADVAAEAVAEVEAARRNAANGAELAAEGALPAGEPAGAGAEWQTPPGPASQGPEEGADAGVASSPPGGAASPELAQQAQQAQQFSSRSGTPELVGSEPSAPMLPPPACGGDADAAATKGEFFHLRAEVVGKLDSLAAELRRTLAATSLAQSVAATGGGNRHTVAVMGGGGGSPGAAAAVGMLRNRRHSFVSRTDSQALLAGGQAARRGLHWNYGHLQGSP